MFDKKTEKQKQNCKSSKISNFRAKKKNRFNMKRFSQYDILSKSLRTSEAFHVKLVMKNLIIFTDYLHKMLGYPQRTKTTAAVSKLTNE